MGRQKVTASAADVRPGRRFRASLVALAVLGVAILLFHLLLRSTGGGPAAAPPGPPAAAGSLPAWGRIECTPIFLQRPDEAFRSVPPAPLEWVFDNMPEAEVVALLNACGLTDGQKARLLDRACWRPLGEGWVLTPPPDVVRDLDPSARKALYAVLGRSQRNYYHSSPFRFDAGTFDGWLADCGLPEEKQELFRSMTYGDGDTLYFADVPYFETVASREEMLRLGKAMSQTPTLLMKLRVTPDSDVEALAGYWGRAGRGKAMKSFLRSLARVPEGAAVSVSYFFPAFARLHLYTYPDAASNPHAPREDCFWTAMNFFSESPDDRFFDWEYTRQTLRTEYAPVSSGWTFGDLLLLADDRQKAVHMCVYVADDVVFTKNGADVMQPWVLMRLPAMKRRYANGSSLDVTGFRRKVG